MQKAQSTGLYKILEAFKSSSIKAIHCGSETLQMNIRMDEICDRFVIQSNRVVSLRNPIWRLANRNKPSEGDLEKTFARVKLMNGIGDEKYWNKCLLWKQPEYDRDIQFHETLQKRRGTLHVVSRDEWQLNYEISDEVRQYYSTTKRELYGVELPNLLKDFMSKVPRHTFSKLFQLFTGNCVLGKYFRMWCIN